MLHNSKSEIYEKLILIISGCIKIKHEIMIGQPLDVQTNNLLK
jgi:hypothetical protein